MPISTPSIGWWSRVMLPNELLNELVEWLPMGQFMLGNAHFEHICVHNVTLDTLLQRKCQKFENVMTHKFAAISSILCKFDKLFSLKIMPAEAATLDCIIEFEQLSTNEQKTLAKLYLLGRTYGDRQENMLDILYMCAYRLNASLLLFVMSLYSILFMPMATNFVVALPVLRGFNEHMSRFLNAPATSVLGSINLFEQLTEEQKDGVKWHLMIQSLVKMFITLVIAFITLMIMFMMLLPIVFTLCFLIILMPPLAVFFFGCQLNGFGFEHVMLNIILCFFLWVPGVIHAFWYVFYDFRHHDREVNLLKN